MTRWSISFSCIEKLPEGGVLATSEDVEGLIVQGRTLQETIEIARDVARKLIEAQSKIASPTLAEPPAVLDYPLIVSS